MARISLLLVLVLASLVALVQAAAIKPHPTTTSAVKPKPTAKPKPAPKAPSFTVFAKSNLSGKSKVVSGYGCHDHNLGTIGSVRYQAGPDAGTQFYEGKGCTGKVTHMMDTSTVKQMGGPYKSNSVKVTKL